MSASPSLSPYFAGRQAEMAMLQDVFSDIGEAREGGMVWIGGEAGVGKTRLVREFLKVVEGQALCLIGTSVAQSESGLPYAPFTGALRHLVRESGAETVAKRIGFSYSNALALLLPEFGEFPAGESAVVRARMFESVRKLLEVVSVTQPVVLVLEDMHWADAGSRDLLRFLVTNLSGCRVMIIATYRPESDDGSIMGSLVADQARPDRGLLLLLPRLTRKEVSDQLEGLLGYLPPGELVAEVFRRGAGVPLLTEAMIDSHGALRKRLPESIRGLVAATFEELSFETVRLLRAVAVGGLKVSPSVLAKVMGVSFDEVGRLSRPAIEARVLGIDEGSLVFRHALLRDAVMDQMLESDASSLHASYASTLANDPVLCPMTWVSMALAHHWRGAGEPAKALSAAWNAAREARGRYAYDEQLQMLEIVLDLWGQVKDADVRLGVSRLEILEAATDTACWAAEPSKGLACVSLALADTDAAKDPGKTASLLLQRAILRKQQLMPGEMDDLRQAASLAIQPDVLRAETLGQLSRALILRRQVMEARAMANELSEVATTIGSQEFALEGLLIAAHLDALAAGKADALLRPTQRARQAALWRLEMIGYLAQLDVLTDAAEHREVVRAGLFALDRAVEVGQTRYVGPALSQFVADSMILLGDWAAAQRLIDQALDLSPPPLGRLQLLQSAASIACARGQSTTVRNILQEVRALDASAQADRQHLWRRLELEIGLALLTSRRDVAIAESTAIPAYLHGQNADTLPLMCLAARALQSFHENGEALAELLAVARPILGTCRDDHPFATLLMAESHVGPAADALELWRQATASFAKVGYPYHEAYCAYRVGLAVAESGKRADAVEPVRRAAMLARELGCKTLFDEVMLLAHRARVKISEATHSGAEEVYDLTDRELQVLKLVAAGKRNRDIAKELYISPKTASVHVSNILSKLNVKTRSAAAVVAHKARLTEET